MRALLLVCLLVGCARPAVQGVPMVVPAMGDAVPVPTKLYLPTGFLSTLTLLQQHVDTEFMVCVTGAMSPDHLHIFGVRLAVILSSTPVGVSYSGCYGDDVLGTLHTHPADNRFCFFSETDQQSFDLTRLPLDLLLCGQGELRYRVRGNPQTYGVKP